ncbi:hypothetical protein [Blastomonas sp. AAP53]|uniref:hypothetical protein n=1 Tax=Blastomonas sp. AAP53 TaxID=1248760 RepID=UPI0002E32C89|nr:hypothetical protein [Blastomonas sp. AAP53]
MKAIVAGMALCALTIGSPSCAQPLLTGANRPVMLKADDGLDPCALGAITGAGEGAIMVFPSNTTDPDAIDFMSDGEQVWLCDGDEGSDMIGIVYSRDPDVDCGVGSPVSADRPYAGPCKTGWVKAQWVQVIAG